MNARKLHEDAWKLMNAKLCMQATFVELRQYVPMIMNMTYENITHDVHVHLYKAVTKSWRVKLSSLPKYGLFVGLSQQQIMAELSRLGVPIVFMSGNDPEPWINRSSVKDILVCYDPTHWKLYYELLKRTEVTHMFYCCDYNRARQNEANEGAAALSDMIKKVSF